MAITQTNKIAMVLGTFAAGSFTTPSVTTVTGNTYIFTFGLSSALTSSVPSSMATNLGCTWTRLANSTGICVFYAKCTAGATGTFVATGTNGNSFLYDLNEFPGCQGITQSNNTASIATQQSAAVTLTATLSAFASANNATFMAVNISSSTGIGTAVPTAKAGFTQIGTATSSSITMNEWLASNDTSPNVSISADGLTPLHPTARAISLELTATLPIDASTSTVKNSMMMLGCGI